MTKCHFFSEPVCTKLIQVVSINKCGCLIPQDDCVILKELETFQNLSSNTNFTYDIYIIIAV